MTVEEKVGPEPNLPLSLSSVEAHRFYPMRIHIIKGKVLYHLSFHNDECKTLGKDDLPEVIKLQVKLVGVLSLGSLDRMAVILPGMFLV